MEQAGEAVAGWRQDTSPCFVTSSNKPGIWHGPTDAEVTHCNTLQHTATHCNTLQRTATHCNTHVAISLVSGTALLTLWRAMYCMYMYVYARIHIYICLYMCIHIYIYICMYIYMYIYI